MRSRLIRALSASIALLVPIQAGAGIIVLSDRVGPSSERVLVRYEGYPDWGSCNINNFWCLRTTVTIHVTPCPPGVPCVAGKHTITMGAFQTTSLTLEMNTNYSFTGTAKVEVGYVNTDPCTYSCTANSNLAPASYQTAAGPIQWSISPVSEDATTVVVDVVLENNHATTCMGAGCAVREQTLVIEPCALDVDQTGPHCSGPSTQFPGYNGATHRVTLLKGAAYTFSGGASVRGFRPEMGGGCFEPHCSWVGEVQPVQFTGTLATEAKTWGAVKALYRR
jgi:hypothetical protein